MDTEIYCYREESSSDKLGGQLEFYCGGETPGWAQQGDRGQGLRYGPELLTVAAGPSLTLQKMAQLNVRMADGVLVTFFSLLLFPPAKGKQGLTESEEQEKGIKYLRENWKDLKSLFRGETGPTE